MKSEGTDFKNERKRKNVTCLGVDDNVETETRRSSSKLEDNYN